jgi:hypothetical protein
VTRYCELGNEPPGSTKCGEFRDYIRYLLPSQQELSFTDSVSLGRVISPFILTTTGTSAHLKVKVQPITDHKGPEVEKKYSCTLSLTAALDGYWWSTPRPGRFTPGQRPSTHFTLGWVGPRAGLEGCGKSRPYRNSIPGPSSP